jgi:hypothetical protein
MEVEAASQPSSHVEKPTVTLHFGLRRPAFEESIQALQSSSSPAARAN